MRTGNPDRISEFQRKAAGVGHVANADSDGQRHVARNSPHARAPDRGADLCRWIVAGKLHNQGKSCSAISRKAVTEKSELLWKPAPSLSAGLLRRSALAAEGVTPDEVRPGLMGLGRDWRAVSLEAGRKDKLPDALGFAGRSHQGGHRCRQCRAQLRLWHP